MHNNGGMGILHPVKTVLPQFLAYSEATSGRITKNCSLLKATKARRASFTPILATCNAVFQNDAELYAHMHDVPVLP